MTILYTGHKNLLQGAYASEIGAFDWVLKFEVDQFGETSLQRLLDRTQAALKSRSWLERTVYFRRYFSPQITGIIEGDRSLLDPSVRNLTVVFWDVRGFSALSHTLRDDVPELIGGFLKEYYELAARAIWDHNGLLDKFIGDGIMALFGVFDQMESGQKAGAIDAVRTAKALHNEFDALVQKWMPKWQIRAIEAIEEVRLGCGIHTGRALVGNLGTDFRDQFTAVGPHVNFAQRLESMAARKHGGDILISEATRVHVQDSMTISFLGKTIKVRTIPGKHKVYVVDAIEE
jgi:class 3 adenylate cyclase